MFSFFKLTTRNTNRCVIALMFTFFLFSGSTEVLMVVFAVSAVQMPRLVCISHTVHLVEICFFVEKNKN